jgi:hypothetical protein
MKIDITEVIYRTKERLGLEETTRHDARLLNLVNEGVEQLKTPDNYIVSCEILDIDPCGGKAKLPDNCITVLCIAPVTTSSFCCSICGNGQEQLQALSGMSTRCACAPYYVANSSLLTEFSGTGACIAGNVYYEQNGYLILPSTATGQMKVWYRSNNTDCDGIMIIDSEYLRGISAYAAYQFATSGTNYNKYQRGQVEGWRVEWTAQLAHLRASSQLRKFKLDKVKFAAIARAIVARPELIYQNYP